MNTRDRPTCAGCNSHLPQTHATNHATNPAPERLIECLPTDRPNQPIMKYNGVEKMDNLANLTDENIRELEAIEEWEASHE